MTDASETLGTKADPAAREAVWTLGTEVAGRADIVRLVYRAVPPPSSLGTGVPVAAQPPKREAQSLAAAFLDEGIPSGVAARLLGFEERPREGAPPGRGPVTGGPGEPSDERPPRVVEPVAAAPPPPVWRVIGPVVRSSAEERGAGRPRWLDQGARLERLGSTHAPPIPPRPLIPLSRLGCVLRQRLRRLEPGRRLDEKRLVDELSRARLLRHLPRVVSRAWPRRLQLYWDCAPATAFCWEDQARVARLLERWLGELSLEFVFIEGVGRVRHWARGTWQPLVPADASTTILALSDLGAADRCAERQGFWSRQAIEAARAGAHGVALVLCPHARWPKGLARGWDAIDWEHARPFRAAAASRAWPDRDGRVAAAARDREARLARKLTALLAPTLRVEPGLLREARDLLRAEGATFATELDFWLSDAVKVRGRDGGALSDSARREGRADYLALEQTLRRAFESLLERHHARLSPVILAEELFACSREPATLGPGEAEPPLQKAQAILADYARRLESVGVGSDTEGGFLERLTRRQGEGAWADEHLAAVWALGHRDAERRDFTAELPNGLSLAQVAYALEPEGAPSRLRLWQQGHVIRCELVAHPSPSLPAVRGFCLAELPVSARLLQFEMTEPLGSSSSEASAQSGVEPRRRRTRRALLRLDDRPVLPLPEAVPAGSQLTLRSDLAEVHLAADALPPWASMVRRDKAGLWVTAEVVEFEWGTGTDDSFGLRERGRGARSFVPGEDRVAIWAFLSRRPRVASVQRSVRERPVLWPPWASSLHHDEFGLVATLRLNDTVTTRLRWIPPGTFLMGSPKDEKGRIQDEGPQHWVKISRGFWLGEAACTQAEWEAVMGENPSHFKDEADPSRTAQRPVERVSWEACERFCERLNERKAGLGARLPTEGEWEYACRAGTASAYNDGSACTEPEGRDPALMELGWYRENSGRAEGQGRTHEVKGLKPNGWGLYDMHGNVWEWCWDWYGPYAKEEQRDPRGPAEGRYRVMRGGSWFSNAGYCRSARRSWGSPGTRSDGLGFRLLAGQPGEPSEPGKSGEPGAEPQGGPSEGRGATRSGARQGHP